MKRIASVFLVLCILLTLAAPGALAAGLDNFKSVNTYAAGQFSDVPEGSWFESYVKASYELGLMLGEPGGSFNSGGNLTIAEAVTMAARLHSIYSTGAESFKQGQPWYQVYVDYALANGIIGSGFSDYTVPATRTQFAVILSGALPASTLEAINTVDDGMIPDVPMSASYAPQVYMLYRAGVLTGNDAAGTFTPDNRIERCQAAAILSRMAKRTLRRPLELRAASPLTAEQLFTKCSSSVFFIEVFDSDHWSLATGSGFFISDDGTAVTNYHVIDGASYAVIRTSDGSEYDVLGWSAVDEANDLAILKINGSGFPYLKLGNSRSVATGATVYAIGSPLGLENTLSQGIISSRERLVDGIPYIQTTAPISPGSSGGALLDVYGNVIGVTAAQFVDGQNLNLALPIHLTEGMNRVGYTALSALVSYEPEYGEIYPSVYSLVMYVGQTETVDITETSSDVMRYFTFYIDDETTVSCAWQDWLDGNYTCPLDVTALSVGYTYVTVYAYADADGSTIGSTYFDVTVLPNPASLQYYYGFTAPTYESVTGSTCSYTYFSETDTMQSGYYAGGDIYYYPFNDSGSIIYTAQLEALGWELYDFYYLSEADDDYSYVSLYIKDGKIISVGYLDDMENDALDQLFIGLE